MSNKLKTAVFGVLYAATVIVATYVIMEKANAQVVHVPGGGYVINFPQQPRPRPVQCFTSCIGTFCTTTCN